MVILCVAGILFTGGNARAQGLTIAVAPESQVTGQFFTLGDIARISGDDAGRIASLEQIRLGRTPAPGQSILFSAELLAIRLNTGSHDLTGLTWQVPPQFRVTALSQVITGERLTGLAAQYLREHLTGSDVELLPVGQPQDLVVPPGAVGFTIELPYGLKYNAPTTVHIGLNLAGQPYTAARVRIDIKRYEQVAVASRAIAPRDLITADNIIFERRDTGRMPPGYFTDPDQVLGLAVKRQLSPGTAISESVLVKPLLIKRGQTVRIVAQTGGIEVSAPGVALQSGSEGQSIRVQNTTSRKVITARIMDETTVLAQI
ncbi:flagella basal body P-ring formation protein FlgA [Sporomusa termitida]|uniref:Flagella basal body P-ring formation protein FlgA n=2 Tax=Sporomusa termitida TaxID=2377 RepID=A0A517DXX0_9FIRM|nr:flagella basal body P-ring formation protein FlgA [Sporomusa termitida]